MGSQYEALLLRFPLVFWGFWLSAINLAINAPEYLSSVFILLSTSVFVVFIVFNYSTLFLSSAWDLALREKLGSALLSEVLLLRAESVPH